MSRALKIGVAVVAACGFGALAVGGVVVVAGLGAVGAITSSRASPPDVTPVPTAKSPTPEDPCPGGCITFVVNVHDVDHISESADTLLHAIDIYTSHGVKGEFYLTGAMVEHYVKERPDVIARLKATGMTVSYHLRPPHPLYAGFDSRLKSLSDADLATTLQDYETYAINRTTGELDRTRPGGYALVRDTFGSSPVTVSAMTSDPRLRKAALSLYRSMGARAAIFYHEQGAPVQYPLETREGLVVRPSDFSVTRWDDGRGHSPFWWSRVLRDPAYNPLDHLQSKLGEWTAPRGAFVTVLMHENDFMRADAPQWTYAYYPNGDGKAGALAPPWTVDRADPTRTRSPEERAAIWSAYDELVSWSSTHLHVVTDADIVGMPQR